MAGAVSQGPALEESRFQLSPHEGPRSQPPGASRGGPRGEARAWREPGEPGTPVGARTLPLQAPGTRK